MVAPAGTPPQIVAALNKATVMAMQDPGVVSKLATQGAILEGQTPEQFRGFIDKEIKKWARVIQEADVHVDK
jgi:tripartite-type tricarboxylate transporter receptor subunit TctC